jgi:glutamine---fructose-6-phosphate transaminase (isomerizing)
VYSELPPDIRHKHPYHMYDEIALQPQAVARSFDLFEQYGGRVVDLVASARRVVVTGCGTSFHGALSGAWLLRALGPEDASIQAIQAYELVTYNRDLRPDDLLIALSHSGTSYMTLRALDKARLAGAETVLLTGFPDSPGAQHASHVVPTGYSEERSWAHTVSYTAALAIFAALASTLNSGDRHVDFGTLPAIVQASLSIEEMAHRLAASLIVSERYREPGNIVIIGGGPQEATAHEGVLKLLETSFVNASAFELEQSLHGPLASLSDGTLVLLLVPPGRSTERAVELERALRQIGIVPVVFCGEENANSFQGSHTLVMPAIAEELSAITYVIPLQFFSYFLSIGKGINPDLIRRDEDRYRLAAKEYR